MKHIKPLYEFITDKEKAEGPNPVATTWSNPAFIEWFGESKVTVPAGTGSAGTQPRVVYHGTPAYGFTEFTNDYKQVRNTDNETNSMGIWFCSSKRHAEKFLFDRKGGVYACYLKMENPKVFTKAEADAAEVTQLEAMRDELDDKMKRMGYSTRDMKKDDRLVYNQLSAQLDELTRKLKLVKSSDSFVQFMNYRDKFARYIDGVEGEAGHWAKQMINTNKEEANKKLVAELRNAGHDGIIIQDTVYDAGQDASVTQYCVFDPKNIKSADKNRGTFKDTPNIYERRAL